MGGEHKCPLCSATFTRPQHVGRHLRSHTGDRPYACKECPLRFARSDLLSRHVNKAHKPPEEGGGKSHTSKKGRRKSMSNATIKAPLLPPRNETVNDKSGGLQGNASASPATKARRASMNDAAIARTQLFEGQYQQPQLEQHPLQAHRMYPHHPLSAVNPPPSMVGMPQQNGAGISFWQYSSVPGMLPQHPPYQSPTSATIPFYQNPNFPSVGPMGQTALPQNMPDATQMGATHHRRSSSSASAGQNEHTPRKKACDQCTISKVRCDFAEPCHRCASRNTQCTYMKTPKLRHSTVYPNVAASHPLATATAELSDQFNAAQGILQQSFVIPQTSPQSTGGYNETPSPLTTTSQLNGYNGSQVYANQGSWQSIPNQDIGSWPSNYSPKQMSMPQPAPVVSLNHSPQTAQALPPIPQPQIFASPGSTNSPPTSTLMPNIGYSAMAQPIQGSNTSPRLYFAPTPSLTSMTTTTSPSGSEEPLDPQSGRKRSISSTQAWSDQQIQIKRPDDYSIPAAQNSSPVKLPQQINAAQAGLPSYLWPDQKQSATIDPRLNLNINTMQDTMKDMPGPLTATPLSAVIAQLDPQQQAQILAQHHRRRSSAGIWASAFDQMTLQDVMGNTGLPPDPFTASLIAQQAQKQTSGVSDLPGSIPELAKRVPTKSATTMIQPMSPPRIAPTLAETKDLWKLFMSEPMTGPMSGPPPANITQDINVGGQSAATVQPQILPQNAEIPEQTGPPAETTSRPRLGSRGMSKSTSMPDLQSPLQEQAVLLSPDTVIGPETGASSQVRQVQDDGEAMRKWRDAIKNRQTSFAFSPKSNTRLSPEGVDAGVTSSTSSLSMHSSRPRASVVQHSSLLETLAPERAISWGLPTPFRNDFQFTFGENNKDGSGPKGKVAALAEAARPGNKRLASQTLVPSDQPKFGRLAGGEGANFEIWTGDGEVGVDGQDGGFNLGIIPNEASLQVG